MLPWQFCPSWGPQPDFCLTSYWWKCHQRWAMATQPDHHMLPPLGVHGTSYMFHLYLLPIQLVQWAPPAGLGIKTGKMQKPASPTTYKGSLGLLPVSTEARRVFMRMNRIVTANNAQIIQYWGIWVGEEGDWSAWLKLAIKMKTRWFSENMHNCVDGWVNVVRCWRSPLTWWPQENLSSTTRWDSVHCCPRCLCAIP